MNEWQQHRNPWAEKLSQVTLPDGGESWKAMEALLDREMPHGGSRDKRRWFLLILLLLLLIGVCNCPGRKWLFSRKSTAGGTFTPVPVAAKGEGGPVPGAAGAENRGVGDSGVKRTNDAGTPERAENGGVRESDSGSGVKRAPYSVNGVKRAPDKGGVGNSVVERRNGQAGIPGASKGEGNGVKKSPTIADTGTTDMKGGSASTANARPGRRQDTTIVAKPGKGNKGVPKTTATAAKDKEKKADSAKKERHDGWMVGIGLNQFFTVGGQQASSFNSGGITGTLGDYIPVPMVRYYVNPKLYVQLEAQINTPQYTKKNLVAVSIPHDSLSPVQYVQRTVAINKLFYFNVPFSVHYNVVDHLDLGAGLQYSRLTNGVGVFNNNFNNNGTDSLESETKSIKGDPAYKEIKTHEFRFLVDANYNWKHFIVGIRYNQALSKFIHVEISPGQVTQSRNSSLQLYLRYILWDGRKKKSLSPAK